MVPGFGVSGLTVLGFRVHPQGLPLLGWLSKLGSLFGYPK